MPLAYEPLTMRARVAIFVAGLLVLIAVISLLRSRRLKEEYALLWLAAAATLLLVSFFSDLLDQIAFFLGVAYPPALYFGLAIVGLLLILFQVSHSLSRFSDHIRVLTQEVAILRHRLDELEERSDGTYHSDASDGADG